MTTPETEASELLCECGHAEIFHTRFNGCTGGVNLRCQCLEFRIFPASPPTEASELKPCPFCGSNDVRIHGVEGKTDALGYTDWLIVTCESCGTQSADVKDRIHALEIWNCRPSSPPIEFEKQYWSVEELKEEITEWQAVQDDLLARIAELEAELHQAREASNSFGAGILKRQREIVKLRAALGAAEGFAGHQRQCRLTGDYAKDWHQECSCGYQQVRDQIAAALESGEEKK